MRQVEHHVQRPSMQPEEPIEMLQRIGILVGSLAAAATVATALLFSSVAGPTTAAPVTTASPSSAQPRVQVDTVYVAPPPPAQTITVQRTLPAGQGDDHESEPGTGGDD
jgi:hypothetical protein